MYCFQNSIDSEYAMWESLIGTDVRSINILSGGRNSRVYKIITCDGQYFAGKKYFLDTNDGRDRLGTEWQALHFLEQCGFTCIPHPIAFDRDCSCAVYSFCEGQKPKTCSDKNLLRMADFICQLYDVRDVPAVAELAPASEACFSVQDAIHQLHSRLKCLHGVSGFSPIYQECVAFLLCELEPRVKVCVAEVQRYCEKKNIRIQHSLGVPWRIPSPSDFGLHNTLQCHDGTMCFVDFEYFGVDDPAKLLADVCLHPAMALTAEQAKLFVEHILQHVADQDCSVRIRLGALLPLLRLKWCCILLNEFLPQVYVRREFAATEHETHDSILHTQLAKARQCLQEDSYDTLFV